MSRIRSFDNKTPEVIAFEPPLTLIVGTNGSGKTTIIEALKYATTGEQPSNTRGGAFIHDPDLVGEKEVKAQVKMSFESTDRSNMIVTRSLCVVVKRTTRQQKTLDNTLHMVRQGEKTVISSRNAELDQLMPRYLGVSKAILESVIFCHQDDSLWPMSEPAALKKRFDEIFEAQKYTKAIDDLKRLKKKQTEALKQYEIHESYSKDSKDKADKAEKKSRELTKELDEMRDEIRKLGARANEAKDKALVARDHASKYTEVVEQLKAAKTHRGWYAQQLETLKTNLEERPESEAWLRSQIEQYEERLKLQQEQEDQQTKRYKEIEMEISTLRQRQSDKRVEHGKYKQQKETHEKRIQERNAEIKDCAKRNSLRGYEMELDDMQVNEFMEKITSLKKSTASKLEQHKGEILADVREVQETLDTLREKKSTLQEGRKSAKEQTKRNEEKVTALHNQLRRLSTDETGKTALEGKITELNNRLKEAEQHKSTSNFQSKIDNAKWNIQKLENEGKALNDELMQSSNEATELAKLNHLKKGTRDRQKDLETMKALHGPRLSKLIGTDWQVKKLDADFQNALDGKKGETDKSRSKRDAKANELTQVQYKLKTATAEIKAKETELSNCAKIVRDKSGGPIEEYSEALEEAESNYATAQANVDGFKPLKDYYLDAIKKAQPSEDEADGANDKPPHCKLCLQRLKTDEMVHRFVDRLEKVLEKQSLEVFEKDRDGWKTYVEDLKKASQSYDTWKRLSEKELPQLKVTLSELTRESKTLGTEVEAEDEIVGKSLAAQQEMELLSKPISNIVKCSQDLEGMEDQIKSLEIESQAAGYSRPLEDIKGQLGELEEQRNAAKSELSKLENSEKQNRDLISTLLLDLEKHKSKLTTASHELQQQVSLQGQIAELKDANLQQQKSTAKIDAELDELSPEIDQNKKKLEDIHDVGAQKEKLLQKEVNQLSDEVRNLFRADQEIQAYIVDGGSANLNRCEREISSLESQIASSQAEARQLMVGINKIRNELADQAHNKRVIIDNLNYRKMQRDLQEEDDKINRLSAQNAEADQEHHFNEAEHWENIQYKIIKDRTHLNAIAQTKDVELGHLIEEWNTEYKGAALKYRRNHIEVETSKAAVNDLGQYSKALENAILQFHTLKMEHINQTIEELWKTTYQGTDVDTILIRSDNETARGNRSYNYRVCMVKQDVEMDMRGRCSAGQKVLASIIIRLALAECFSEHCGLIALDEPTTNLDRDNIKSLAEALHGIIRQRQAQRNFQLIVITHDEEFLRYMKCADFCDNYYRVFRDDAQKSVIERQRIVDVL